MHARIKQSIFTYKCMHVYARGYGTNQRYLTVSTVITKQLPGRNCLAVVSFVLPAMPSTELMKMLCY